ncbi:MAG TPA: hypothetical protein VHM02_10360 [Thermoanaerobaculia bacterium]|nr:hypothetical protein [Thermoanaerobaculia bacterium]
MSLRPLILALAALAAVPAVDAGAAEAQPRNASAALQLADRDDDRRAARTRPRDRDDDRYDRDDDRRRGDRDRDDDWYDDRYDRDDHRSWERRGRRGASRIPPGHLPPPGYCRDWLPGVPPGRQPPPYPCGRAAFPFLGGGHGVVLHELPRYRDLDARDLERILGRGAYRRLEDEVRHLGIGGRLGGQLDVRAGALRLDLAAGRTFLGRLVDRDGDWVIDEVRPSDQVRHRLWRR